MKKIMLLSGIFLMGAMLFSCAQEIVPAEKLESSSQTKPEITTKESWEVEWEKTLVKARKEGKIVMYTFLAAGTRQALMEGFYKKTGIQVEAVVGRDSELTVKVTTERRAGLYLVDILLSGVGTTYFRVYKPEGLVAPLKPVLFLPEVLDPKLWYKNTLPWVDKDELLIQTRMMPGGSQSDVSYMTGSIGKDELISWYDLLKPKFKGRMNMQDPTVGGKGQKWVSQSLIHYGLDWDYMRALAWQEPVRTRDKRQQFEWVVKGKHILTVNPDSEVGDEFRAAGVPLAYGILKETKDVLGGGSSRLFLFDRAPHPSAAKLFINWFLSKEGQTIFSRAYGIQSARMDTPTDHLPPNKVRQPGIDYPVETEDFHLKEIELIPQTYEIFGPLLK